MMWLKNLTGSRWLLGLVLMLLVSLAPRPAEAEVRLEGEWGGQERLVTLDATGTSRAHAIELLAGAAGWSVIVNTPLSDPIDVHVKDQSATKVLAILLPEGNYVARRSGNLVSIGLGSGGPSAATPAVPPVPPVPATSRTPAASLAHGHGDDRTVFGGDLTINKSEVVHDVAIFGGNVDVYGTVTGDLVVFGGSSHVHDGAKVQGSATVVGGEMRVDDGAVVEHDVGVVGGHLDRGAHASVGASEDAEDDAQPAPHPQRDKRSRAFHEWTERAGSSLSAAALLFVFGSVVIALGTERSRLLRVEVAARPMRTFAVGVVGVISAVAILLALCITLIGIPVALLGAAVFAVASYAGVSAVLTTAGEALLRHRTTSPYVHLAFGCSLYFAVQLLPWVGAWVSIAVALIGVGAIVATRGAGLIPARRRVGSEPRASYGADVR